MIRNYLVYRRLLFLFALLAAALNSLFWWLNGAAPGDVLYSGLLFLAALALVVALDAPLFMRRCKQLSELRENVAGFEQEIPAGSNALEQAYAGIAQGLLQRLRQETDALDRMHRRDIEYYTMWVHQIKTPLSALRLLLEGGVAGQAQLEQELFQIERYVEMALSYARSARMESDMVIEPCDVEAVLRKSIRKYAPQFIAKDLRVQVEGQGWLAPADAKWLAFLLEQLLSNAVKYTYAGGVTARLARPVLEITDTGVGIRPEDLPRVFERGFTGYNGRIDQRASGLGLGMAKRVADALSIRLQMESEWGKGTRVILILPEGGREFE